MYRPTSFRELPEIIKNLLIINGLLFLATISLESYGIDLTQLLGLHQFQSEYFMPHQLITHFFMHGNFTHLFFNMFALWMFGKILENVWGAKRFLIYYIITALGAAALHLGVSQYEIMSLQSQINPSDLNILLENGRNVLEGNQNYTNALMGKLNLLINTPTVGASGAVFGILLAFGMLFPNTLLYIYFAIPIKAKYFVMIYGALELYLGLSNNPADNVAHFAHLGGMLFGFILLKYWQKDRNTFY
ncbi:rhomboid family intramembrane serine protease [Flavobacteriales bacterium]|nr:rhomboid family intramembrane serine protease [Flavobacteriales bacterium]